MKNIPHFTIKDREVISLEEKAQYIKEHLDMTISPCGESYTIEQIDKMLYSIKNDWKESGYYHHQWIEEVYSQMFKRNSKQK